MRRVEWLVMVALAACLSVAGGGWQNVEAHKRATGIVKQRMDQMKSMGETVKAWGAMRKGKANYDAEAVKAQAGQLRENAARIPKLFPKGSLHTPSEALPAIWKNWDDFAKAARSLEALSGELVRQAGRGKEAALPLMVKIAGNCSGCHKSYRQDKK